MNTEFEAKFYPVKKDVIRKTLKDAGATLIHPEALMPMVQFSNWLNGFEDIHYLRIRDEFGTVKLAAKRHARSGDNLQDQKELEIEVSDFETTKNLLESTGLVADLYQEKYREV